MPFFVTPSGQAEELDWTIDAREIDCRIAAGETCYATLGGAVLHGGVQATAFDRALRAVDLFDGKEALAAGSTAGLVPVGQRSDYRVAVHEGCLHHPPLWPSAISRAA